ncbi:hypothetical protein AAA536_20060 [Pseudomonas aeruginosa]
MLPLPAAGAGATGDTAMSSTQHQLIEQCATRLRGIVEALDNIHDNTPHRWSADLDDVHSSAESLLAMIKDQAPAQAAQDLALRTIAEYPCPEQDNMTAANMRQVAADAITGALAFGAKASQPPAEDHWLRPFYDIGRAEGQRTQELAMLVRMLASSLKRHAPESNLVARATNYLAAKGLAGTPLRDAPASVEQAGGDERAEFERAFTVQEGVFFDDKRGEYRSMNLREIEVTDAQDLNLRLQGWQARAALAQPSPKCVKCGGTGMVDDGEITCSEGGIPYENGPVKCVKDCPDCAQPSPALPPFAEKVLAKLRRFYDCASDFESGGVDIGRHWLDLLTQLGLLNRVQRSPALWEISQQGEDLLGMPQPSPAQAKQAERPEVVGYRSKESGMVYEQDYGLKNPEALTTVAECDRIVGELRAENAKLIEALDESDGDRWRLRSERDAALANVDALAVQVLKLGGTISFAHHRADQAGQVPHAWLDVQAERRRQITAEGWTPEHDDEHSHGQMARAAACYALAGSSAPNDGTAALLVSLAWPWDEQWWKPSTARRDLVKACALALAEIERLDRATATQGGPRDA